MARRGKRKKKKRRPTAAQQARRMARALLGTPPGQRVIPSKKQKKPKHKNREFERELGE